MTRLKSSEKPKAALHVHFMSTLNGNRPDFERIFQLIMKFGHKLVTDHVLTRTWEDLEQESPEEAQAMHKTLLKWIEKADVVVYEVSTPSVSVGYEVAYAFTNNIPVILLYREQDGEIPHGLKGINNDLLQLLCYNNESLPTLLYDGLEFAREQVKKRVYVQLTAPLVRYLNWIERTHKLTTSGYLRIILDDDMRGNRAYQAHLREYGLESQSQ